MIVAGILTVAATAAVAMQQRAAVATGWRSLSSATGFSDGHGQPPPPARGGLPLTEAELNLLQPHERSTAAFFPEAATADFQSELSPQMRRPNLVSATPPYHRYWPGQRTKSVAVDALLPAPALALQETDGFHPVVRLNAGAPAEVRDKVRYYFEFDTSPRFDSPNFWRYPPLMPDAQRADLTAKNGLVYFLFTTTVRGVDGRADTIRFPFRVTSMALPLRFEQIDFEDLAKFARLAGHGVPAENMIQEFYNIGRFRFVWANDDFTRRPIDTFKAGLGECAAINDLMGAMLEMNGYRYRLVAGFNPVLRQVKPAGGHSAIEVYDRRADRWEYVDSYLDIHVPGVSAERFADHAIGKTWVYGYPEQFDQTTFGDHLDLAGLFRFRLYGDVARRLPMIGMLRLGGDEGRYGLTWPLRRTTVIFDPDKDVPARVTIHVRGRYVLSTCKVVFNRQCGDPAARASPWGHAQFTIAPRKLLARSRADPT